LILRLRGKSWEKVGGDGEKLTFSESAEEIEVDSVCIGKIV
jgi:hypothetical protein